MAIKRIVYRAWADTLYPVSNDANFVSLKDAEDAARKEVDPGHTVYIMRIETVPYGANGRKDEWITKQDVVKEFRITEKSEKEQ